MLAQIISTLFKYKVIGNLLVLTCSPAIDRVKFARELFKYEIIATFSCDPAALYQPQSYRLQGVLYFTYTDNDLLKKVERKFFSDTYKWIIIADNIHSALNTIRYDADILWLRASEMSIRNHDSANKELSMNDNNIFIDDIYVHPRDGASTHPWGYWNTNTGLKVLYDRNRVLRRQNLKGQPLKIATPLGLYSKESYDGTFKEYLTDMSMPERDSGVKCGYGASSLIIEYLNGSEIIVPTKLWSTEVNNSSMMLELKYGSSELGGGVLRMMTERFKKLDYAMCIWPFSVGFTYLAERESSSNMFMEPFTANVWWCTLGLFLILALAQRVTAKEPVEKEGAYIAVLATYLQQDASAVPEGISGRWTFLVLSISAMLIHAYYTSAIVSALMSAGRSGPDSLRSLGDSKYAIASEDYDYMRYLMFDVPTNRDDLEYLKRKKLTPKFYQDIQKGVRMIQDGNTAYHTEYNQLYPHLKTFTDDQLCKLQYVDTVPEILSWVTTTKHGEWTNFFRITGARLHETGLAKRLVSRIRMRPPPCRAAMLAERVNMDDVAPAVILTVVGALTSLMLLGLEVLTAKWRNMKTTSSVTMFVDEPEELVETFD